MLADSVQAKDKKYGVWSLSKKRDRLTDQISLVASTPAIRDVALRGRKVRPYLLVRCEDDLIEAYVYYGAFVSCSDPDVIMRAESDDTISNSWAASTDCDSAFWPDDYSAGSLVIYLSVYKNVAIRVSPYLPYLLVHPNFVP
jgi:hypothetical protein